MTADAKKRDRLLPDNHQLNASRYSSGLWIGTMLTGEPLAPFGDVQVRALDDGKVVSCVRSTYSSYNRSLCVRPAVVIAEINS